MGISQNVYFKQRLKCLSISPCAEKILHLQPKEEEEEEKGKKKHMILLQTNRFRKFKSYLLIFVGVRTRWRTKRGDSCIETTTVRIQYPKKEFDLLRPVPLLIVLPRDSNYPFVLLMFSFFFLDCLWTFFLYFLFLFFHSPSFIITISLLPTISS